MVRVISQYQERIALVLFQQPQRRASGFERVLILILQRILRDQQPVNRGGFERRLRLLKRLAAERFGVLEAPGQAFEFRLLLRELERGRTNKEIAEHLGIAIATVKLHVQAILSATGARNRTEVVSRMASGQTRPPN